FRQTGYDAQVSCKSITPEQAEKLASHPDVKELGQSIVLGLAENSKLGGRQVEIRWADDSYAAHSFAAPTTGRMPQSADEVALDTIALDRLGIPHEIGQRVTLEWRKDSSDPGAEPVQAVFTLCGFWEGNQSGYASMAWVSREYANAETQEQLSAGNSILGLYMVQVSLYSDSNIEGAMDRILSDTGLDGLEYGVNLAYSPEMGATAIQETLPMYLGMVLVFLAGYLIIYNIFQISVTADVQFYGKLKTLGTTDRQIRKLIYGQAGRLCMIGIPVGLVSGWLLGIVLVPAFTGILEGGGAVSADPLIFIGSAVFAWLTVLISCLRPARLAGKVSPVEALRMNDTDTSGRKKTKRSHTGESLAGMAWENLGRNRKRTVTVICSLTLGLVLLSCFYAKNAAFDMEKYLADLTIADFELADATNDDYIRGYDPRGATLGEDLVQELESMEGVEAAGHQYSHQFIWQFDDQTAENLKGFYTDAVLADWARYDPEGAERFHHAVDTREMNAVVLGLDGIPLDAITQPRYILEGSFIPDAFSGGDYVLAIGPAIGEGMEYPVLPVPSVGSTVTLEGRDYTVMAIVFPRESVDGGASEAGAPDAMEQHFILPGATFRQKSPE
ncbi:MAG: FtsX-like permease family protein, partial [Acetatifactor sp.]|nr:FtsX-like permease family protein [Acetatifactor sp.]